MPDNNPTPDCLHKVGGAQLFMAPTWIPEQKGGKVQIIDVFALEGFSSHRIALRLWHGCLPPVASVLV